LLRLLFLATLALTIAGVRMYAQPDEPSIIRTGRRLAEAGSATSIALLVVCLGGEVYIWLKYRHALSPQSQQVRVL